MNFSKFGLITLIFLTSFVLYIQHGQILGAKKSEVIQPSGDAFNAYKLVTYHAKYDSTYSFFGGNGYPYGEHVVIASALPLISNGLQCLKKSGLDLTDYCIPIIHLSIIFSYLLCSIFLYLIFIRFSLPTWYSIIVAIGITTLSPQNDRIFGHLGLAHAFVIPATIYFLFLFKENPNCRNSIFLFLTVMLSSLIQFYFFAITAFLIVGFYFFSYMFKHRKINDRGQRWNLLKSYATHFAFQVILPFAFFQYWLSWFPIKDRPNEPAGYLDYVSSWEGIFLSKRMPYYKWIHENLFRIDNINLGTNFEGLAYSGICATVMVILMIRIGTKSQFKQSIFSQMKLNNKSVEFLKILFLTSLGLALFSFGLPFSLPKLSFLLDYAGPIKQFRSVGRFNWIFYYSINIITFIYLYHNVWLSGETNDRKNNIYCKGIVLFLISLLLYEAWQFNRSRPHQMTEIRELQEENYFQKNTKLDFSKFQALLPLPFFHVGTDNFNPQVSSFMQQKSLLFTMESGLPSIASLSNRSSISRTFNLFQSVSEPYRKPNILNDLPNDKPILLMVDESLASNYQYITDSLKLISSLDNIRYYDLPINSFLNRINKVKSTVEKEVKDNGLFLHKSFHSSDSLLNFSYKDYNTGLSDVKLAYKGKGGLALNIIEPKVIFQEQIPNAVKGGKYILSFWCYLLDFPAATTFVSIKELSPNSNEHLWHHFPQVRNFLPVMDKNGWALFEFSFEMKGEGFIEVSLYNKNLKKYKFYLDELLIRKDSTNIYKISTDKYLFKNNRWYLK